ncbi:MAG: PAS domain S-box protein [Gallionella sp.]
MDKKRNQTSKPKDSNSLRARAEGKIEQDMPVSPQQRPAEELLQELRIYQVELEMQNEALRESQVTLEEARDRYLDLYEFAPIGYLTLSPDDVIKEVNLTGAALLGMERSKLINRRFMNFVVPEDQDRWYRIFIRTAQQGAQQSCDLMLMRGDGSRLHVQMDSIHLFREGKEPAVRLTLTDITRHDRAQATERRLNNLLDNTLDMIFIFEPDTLRFVYANKGASTGTGYSREELLEMNPLDLLPQIPEAECRAFIAPLAGGKRKRRRFETTVSRSDGRDIPVETQLQFIRQNHDQGLYVAIVRDITERKFAERELRRQKNLMWQVIDTDPNMIFVKDEQGRFLLANQAIADYYEISIPDMIGKRNSEINRNAQEVAKFHEADREVIEKRHEVVLTELLVKNGLEHWAHTVKRPLQQDDGSVNVLGISVDITELKAAENKLAESYRELQRLSLHLENVRAEERAMIARNLHDEMGATLAALKMRIAWLASRLPATEPLLLEEADHISELVSAGIKTMRRVVSDLRPNLLDDVGLAAALKDYVKRFGQDSGIECRLVLPQADVPLDENQSVTVFRIIQEALSNVSKHAQASRVDIALFRRDDSLLLEIRDNGIGFDPDRRGHTFGLLGIKERAMMVGGTAMISSAPGEGTVVAVTIPAARPPDMGVQA